MDRIHNLILRPIKANICKLSLYCIISLIIGVVISRVIGESFDETQVKFRGERNRREERSVSDNGPLKDPFPERPRIRTRNGHLVIEASQDKSIEFRTSGSQGSVSINGLRLDKLFNVTKALEKSTISGLSSAASDPMQPGDQDSIETALTGLFAADQRIKNFELRLNNLTSRLNSLVVKLDKFQKKWKKRTKLLDDLTEDQEDMKIKLQRNECYKNGKSGSGVCKNGATCLDLYDGFKCLCPPEWEGEICDQDVNECLKFRGTDLGCQNGAQCVNLPGTYRCDCQPNFHGVHCTEQHDDCALSSSRSLCGHGKCIDLARTVPNQVKYECVCDQGWTTDGVNLACTMDIDECSLNNSSSGPNLYPCSTQPFVTCTNLPGSFRCDPCPTGYQGNGRICTDIDECLVNNGGCSVNPLVECINLIGSRRCGSCPAGYTGDGVTCSLASPCSSGNGEPNGGCHPMARCIPLGGLAFGIQSRICDCQYPYSGSGIGPLGCQLNGGMTPPSIGIDSGPLMINITAASDTGGAGGASDIRGNIGGQKTNALDPCAPNPLPPCQNGASCRVDRYGGIECICPLGWGGAVCSEQMLGCQGKYHTTSGKLLFPPPNADLKEIAKVIKVANGTKSGPTNARTNADNSVYHCSWVISSGLSPAASNHTLTIELNNVMRKLDPTKQVEMYIPNSSGSIPDNYLCIEKLDIFELIPAPMEILSNDEVSIIVGSENITPLPARSATSERSRIRRRLIARICPQFKSHSFNDFNIPTERVDSKRKLSFPIETNEAQLEYGYFDNSAGEPELSFSLEWKMTEPACGGELPVADSGSVSSPKFPEFYRAGSECRWVVRVPSGRRIRIQIGDLMLLSSRESIDKSCSDSLTILDGAFGSQRPVLFRECGNNLTASGFAMQQQQQQASKRPSTIVSSSSVVEIILDSDLNSDWPATSSRGRMRQKHGFFLTYASEASLPNCGGLYTGRSGSITSPDFDQTDSSTDKVQFNEPGAEINLYYFMMSRFGNRRPKETIRCEYELRPVNQLKNQHVSIDKVYLPSVFGFITPPWPTPNSSGRTKRFRDVACKRARLTIYDPNLISYDSNDLNDDLNSTKMVVSTNQPMELATFCYGDYFDAHNMDSSWSNNNINRHSKAVNHIFSSSHSLMVVYETTSFEANNKGYMKPANAIGFQLQYSTICTATLQSLAAKTEMNLGADIDFCLYNILLPPNNAISVVIKPKLNRDQTISSAGWLNSRGDCKIEAYFTDGPLKDSHKSIYEIQSRITQVMQQEQQPNATNQQKQATTTGGSFRLGNANQRYDGENLLDFVDLNQEAGGDNRREKLADQFNIKQFDICNLNTFDSIWNHASILVRRKSTANRNNSDIRVSIEYQAEPSCGGVISEPKNGTINIISGQKIVQILKPPLTATRFQSLYEKRFYHRCAWTIRAAPGQVIQLSFQAPDAAIRARLDEWKVWTEARQQKQLNELLNITSSRTSTSTSINGNTMININQPNQQQCNQIFMESIELYEPILNQTKVLCLNDLLPSNATYWSSMSNIVYIRLLNNTRLLLDLNDTSLANQTITKTTISNERPPMVKPLLGRGDEIGVAGSGSGSGANGLKPLMVNYKILASNESGSYGGRLIFDSGVIRSPEFPYVYPPRTNITWIIEAKLGQQIRLNFTTFDLESHQACIFDYLELYDGIEPDSPLIGRFCGRQLQSRILICHSNLLRLKFVTDGHLQKAGFELYYDGATSGCGGILRTDSGQIDSPYYPRPFAQSALCEWTIEVNSGSRIEVTIVDLQLGLALPEAISQSIYGCGTLNATSGSATIFRSEYLELKDSLSWNGEPVKSLGRWCQLSKLQENQRRFVTKGNKLSIRYQSQAYDQSPGFRITYKTVCNSIELNALSGAIESPGYPGVYKPSLECGWYLRGPMGSKLHLVITHLSVDEADPKPRADLRSQYPRVLMLNGLCIHDELAIWSLNASTLTSNGNFDDENDKLNLSTKPIFLNGSTLGGPRRVQPTGNATRLASLCGELAQLNNSQKIYQLDTNRAYISFNTDEARHKTGFRLEWQFDGCGGDITLVDESLGETIFYHEKAVSANHPGASAYECIWNIRSNTQGQQMELYAYSNMFQIDPDPRADLCKESSLTIYDGSDIKSSPILMQNCDSKQPHRSLYTSGDSAVVRFFSSGKRYSGHEFRIMTHPGYSTKCISQEISPQSKITSWDFNQYQRTLKWPAIYQPSQSSASSSSNGDDQYVTCQEFTFSSGGGRFMLRVDDLNIPYEPVATTNKSEINNNALINGEPPSGLLSSDLCKNSKNFLSLFKPQEYLCGQISKLDDDNQIGIAPASMPTYINEKTHLLMNFKARASLGASFKLSLAQLCGSRVTIKMARDFTTPRYPDQPKWVRSDMLPSASENVCLWRFEPDYGDQIKTSSNNGTGDLMKLYFQLINFVASPNNTKLNYGDDCLRVYEGIDINLKQSQFNLTNLDRQYSPQLKICQQQDLINRGMSYASRGQAIYVLVSGLTIAKFRVHPFDSYCGGEFQHNQAEIVSLDYTNLYSAVANDLDCFYHITGAPGSKIKLDLIDIRLPEGIPMNDNQKQVDCDDVSHIEVYRLPQLRKSINSRGGRGGPMDGYYFYSTNGRKQANTNQTSPTTNIGAAARRRNRLFELAQLYQKHLRPATVGFASSQSNLLNQYDYHNGQLIGKFCGTSPGTKSLTIDGDTLIRYRHFKDSLDKLDKLRVNPYKPQSVLFQRLANKFGFLANYKINYGGQIQLDPSKAELSIGIIGSPQFPRKLQTNETYSWYFVSNDPDSVIQFELISLDLGGAKSSSISSNGTMKTKSDLCQDSLQVFDGANPEKDPRLAKFCGQLVFKVTNLPTAPAAAAVINKAADPLIEKNLIKLVQTSTNIASMVYDNRQIEGQFLIRYKVVRRSEMIVTSANLNSTTGNTTSNSNIDDDSLLLDDALHQRGIFDSAESNYNNLTKLTTGSSRCSRTIQLSLRTSNASLREQILSSPNWPGEPHDTVECHWLVMTNDNHNIRFGSELIDLGVDLSETGSASGGGAGGLYRSPEYCSEQAYANTKRAFLIVHDGSSVLSPEIARYCLPMVPAQLQSTGRYMLIRYVFQLVPAETDMPNKSGSATDNSAADNNSPAIYIETRPRRFKARVSLLPCGGHYHVSNMLLLYDDDTSGSTTGHNYDNKLDCSYFLFAASLKHSLAVYWQRFELASDPTNSDCTLGDYVELKLLNFIVSRPMTIGLDGSDSSSSSPFLESLSFTVGRSLGRFCAGKKPPMKATDSYGPGVMIEFHTDDSDTAPGWSLVAVSQDAEEACTREIELDSVNNMYVRFMSPNWPHGFYGQRDCLFLITTKPNQTLTVDLLRIRRSRASDWGYNDIASSASAMTATTTDDNDSSSTLCKDSMSYLDDNQATLGVLTQMRLLFSLNNRAKIGNYKKRIRKLIKQVKCNLQANRRTDAAWIAESAERFQQKQGFNFSSLMQLIDSREYYAIKNFYPIPDLTITTNSSALLFRYKASDLLPGEGFLGLIKAQDKQTFKCGGQLTATENLLVSALFNQTRRADDAYEQCLWEFPSIMSWNGDRNYVNLMYASSQDQLNGLSSGPDFFKTAFVVFDVLEIPPAIENERIFEAKTSGIRDKSINARIDETCDLNRLVIRSRYDTPIVACGNLTDKSEAKWLPIKSVDSDLMLRTKNFKNERTGLVYRGLKAWYHESNCKTIEMLPGDGCKLQSNLNTSMSYQPSICWWQIDLNGGDFQIWFNKLHFRKPQLQLNITSQSSSTKQQHLVCDPTKYPDLDYLEIRATASASSAVIERYCYLNEEQARLKPANVTNSIGSMYVQFVAGLEKLRKGLKTFDESSSGQQISSREQKQTAAEVYSFEMNIIPASQTNDFCRIHMDFNFYQMIIHQDNQHDSSFWQGHDLMSIKTYPKNVTCAHIILAEPEMRFNITFYGIFDMESSPDCKNDYLLIENLYNYDENPDRLANASPATQSKQDEMSKKLVKNSSQIAKLCGRKRPDASYVSNSNVIRLTFHSNDRIEGRGFKLLYRNVPALNFTIPADKGEIIIPEINTYINEQADARNFVGGSM